MHVVLRQRHRVLAIYPTHRGFGYAVLEETSLIDWGLARLRQRHNNEFLQRLEGLVEWHAPSLIALERHDGSRRQQHARTCVHMASCYATEHRLPVKNLSRAEVWRQLELSVDATNHDMTRRIAQHFPELAAHVPPKRRLWETETDRTKMFQAVALAFACSQTR